MSTSNITKIERYYFSVACYGCKSILRKQFFEVAVLQSRKPYKEEIVRIFTTPEMDVGKYCPRCLSTEIGKFIFVNGKYGGMIEYFG